MSRSDETRHRPEGRSRVTRPRRQSLRSATNAVPGGAAAGELFIDFHMAGIGSRSGGKVLFWRISPQRRDFLFLAEVRRVRFR